MSIETELTDALAKTTYGFHSSQLEAIMPIIKRVEIEAKIAEVNNWKLFFGSDEQLVKAAEERLEELTQELKEIS